MPQYHPDLAARPVPRYTSYPTAAQFTPAVGAADQAAALAALPARAEAALYLHIPFCRQICWYCGCNTGKAGGDRVRRYLAALEREIDTVAGLAAPRITNVQFGGGSPNALDGASFAGLVARLRDRFDIAPDAEIGVEIDPRALTPDHVPAMAAAGVNRVSLGVQTFAPHVQAAINRIQPFEVIAAAVEAFRRHGIAAINFDLMYGLPGQSAQDLADTIDQAIALQPDRIAVFGYAHLPSAIPRQRMIRDADLPDAAARFAMSVAAGDLLRQAGYVAIGFDHFARGHDSLAVAAREGRLHRNFQGYAPHPGAALIGLGASAISQFAGLFVQNDKHVGNWSASVTMGRLAGDRGVRLDDDDRLRAALIERLLCDGRVTVPPALADVAGRLAPLAARGLIRLHGGSVEILPDGWPYARLAAAAFDAHLKVPQRHSQAV